MLLLRHSAAGLSLLLIGSEILEMWKYLSQVPDVSGDWYAGVLKLQ